MQGLSRRAAAASATLVAVAASAAVALDGGATPAFAARTGCTLRVPAPATPAPSPQEPTPSQGTGTTTTTETTTTEAAPPPTTPTTTTTAPPPAPPPPLVRYPAKPALAVGKTVATLVGTIDPRGGGTAYAFEFGPTRAYGSCTSARTLASRSGVHGVRAKLTGLEPGTTYHFRLVAESAAGASTGRDETFTTVRAEPLVPQGTRILGLRLGGLTRRAAERKVQAAFARPLRFSYRGRTWSATPEQLGARAYVGGAVRRALVQVSHDRRLSLAVAVDGSRVRRYVSYLDRIFAHPAKAGTVRLAGTHAVVVPAREGVAVDRLKMAAAIVHALKTGQRGPLPLRVKTTRAPAASSKAVVVRLDAQSLTAYQDGKKVLATPVTTGRPALPTPVGSFSAAWRASPYTFISPWPKGNPFYYPPTPVTWVIYFYDNDFLHDDPGEPAGAYGPGSENGPYASHGCVHVPHDAMAFLYRWLPNGAPVVVAKN